MGRDRLSGRGQVHWTEDKCRSSTLGRVLPYRGGTRGSSPGLKGAGPQGGGHGDQEQFPYQILAS